MSNYTIWLYIDVVALMPMMTYLSIYEIISTTPRNLHVRIFFFTHVGDTCHSCDGWSIITRWRYQMETCSTLLALSEGNPPVTRGFPSQRPVTRSFDVFFYLRLIGLENNWDADDWRRHRNHYDITAMMENESLVHQGIYPSVDSSLVQIIFVSVSLVLEW